MRRGPRKPRQQASKIRYRRNRQIRMREVRLIDHTGKNIGVVSTDNAMRMAMEAGLDLVEVAPNARPPVAKIVDYSKYVYEKQRKEREARKNQKKVEIKTIKLKVKTSPFHRDIQVRKARGWLENSKKVKAEIRFYGREMDYPELGRKIMDGVIEELSDVSTIEQRPQFERRTMIMMLAPLEAK